MSTRFSRRDFLALAGAALAAASWPPGSTPAAPADRPGPEASRKKGFCTTAGGDGKWRERLTTLRAKWFYTWAADVPEGVPEGVEFVPMVWGYWGQDEAIKRVGRQGAEGPVRHLMGFNEPDQHDQSNMTVEKALEVWPKLMEAGLPLCSPGCVHPDREWMTQFMRGVEERKFRVDYVCVHSYGGTNTKALLDRLKGVHERFGRPLWITEFAAGDWEAKSVRENRHGPKRVAAFIREALPALEAAAFVHRFAWFSAAPDSPALGTSALFDKDGRLTELGEIYRDF